MIDTSPILVATDFSDPAAIAVRRAAQLAGERQCPLRLLYVFNPFAWEHMHRFLPLPLRGSDPRMQADLALDKLAVDLAVRYKLTHISSESVSGRAASQIAERANAAGAGLIVVGVSGEGSLSHELAIGGTAIKVLRQCHCPVLVVRNPSETAYRRILVATDFSATANRALQTALDRFPEAAHTVLHACTVPYEGRMRMEGATAEDIERYRQEEIEAGRKNMHAFLATADRQAKSPIATVVRHGHAAPVLMDEIQTSGFDLLVVGRHGVSVLDERLLGSVTLNLLHHAPCDVLLVP